MVPGSMRASFRAQQSSGLIVLVLSADRSSCWSVSSSVFGWLLGLLILPLWDEDRNGDDDDDEDGGT